MVTFGFSSSAISKFGSPKHSGSFSYVNSNSPKGGAITIGNVGTFDSLNPFSIKGICAYGVLEWVFDPLMVRSLDEPFAFYGVLAESVDISKDNSSLIIKLNKNAKFQDGTSVTADDVKFSLTVLQNAGFWPRYKQFYSKIEKIDIVNPHLLKITFLKDKDGKHDPDIPFIICLARIVSKKNIESIASFENSGLTKIIGSGPYKIKQFDQGRSITYERDKNYWANDLPILNGLNNFDIIKIEYFKTLQMHFLAFQSGYVDIFFETNPTNWFNGYNFLAARSGKVVKLEKKHERPVTVQTIIFNMKKEIFESREFRKALALAMDFESLNNTLFNAKMFRAYSLFPNTKLDHHFGDAQNFIDLIYKVNKDKKLPKELFEPFYIPKTKGDGNQRENLIKAKHILKDLGYLLKQDGKDSKLMDKKGNPVVLEFMIKDPKFEKIALSYKKSLKVLGIELKIRLIDSVQYENKVTERDFDMIIHSWSNSNSPGNEQVYYFSQKTADIKGSSNYIGMKDQIAEDLATLVTNAKTEEDLIKRVHALDQYIMNMYYMIPLSYDPYIRIAYWEDKISFPEFDPKVGVNINSSYFKVSSSS